MELPKVIKFEVTLANDTIRIAEFHTAAKISELWNSKDFGPFLQALVREKEAMGGGANHLVHMTTDER